MQQYLTYLCTDIGETGLSHVIMLRFGPFYVVRFFFFLSGILANSVDPDEMPHYATVSVF